ncbi:MAG: methyltransferase domain-containing protein, partial [Thermoanaerobaculia bacterium]
APWEFVLTAVPAGGSLLDIGCGPGLLAHLLADAGWSGSYRGIDVDARKIERARVWPGETDRRGFQTPALQDVRETFTSATLIDVLYLIPRPARAAFIRDAVRPLAPGGRFVVLTSGGGPRWKRLLDRAQEHAAVSLLRFTAGSVVDPCDGNEVAGYLAAAGLSEIAVTDVGGRYLHGFELITGRR